MKNAPGRPPKDEEDKLEYFIYVRVRADQYELVKRIAKHLGLSSERGMSAAVRWCVDRMGKIIEKDKLT